MAEVNESFWRELIDDDGDITDKDSNPDFKQTIIRTD